MRTSGTSSDTIAGNSLSAGRTDNLLGWAGCALGKTYLGTTAEAIFDFCRLDSAIEIDAAGCSRGTLDSTINLVKGARDALGFLPTGFRARNKKMLPKFVSESSEI